MKPYFRDRNSRGPIKKIKNKYRQELAVTKEKQKQKKLKKKPTRRTKNIVNHEPFPEMTFQFSSLRKYIFVEKGSTEFIRNAS